MKPSETWSHIQVLTPDEEYAIKRVSQGQATDEQQKLAIACIVKKISRAHDLQFVPGSFDQTSFLSGRAFVGKNIIRIVNSPVTEVTDNVQA